VKGGNPPTLEEEVEVEEKMINKMTKIQEGIVKANIIKEIHSMPINLLKDKKCQGKLLCSWKFT
jgi:hypothetical protein